MGKEIAQEWLKASYDDIRVIQKIIDDELLTHIVAFHSQQSIEKSFKALYEIDNKTIPKIHKLQTLVDNIKIDLKLDDTILQLLDKLYIDARYPGNFGLLPYGKPTLEDAIVFFDISKEIYEYVSKTVDKKDNTDE